MESGMVSEKENCAVAEEKFRDFSGWLAGP
jgi:hypothetical protein